jgi:hypothetical protein
LPAKIVVSQDKGGGSRIALVGASGKELLKSQVFHEPRAKGATVRSLKGLLGADIKVEDHTREGKVNGRPVANGGRESATQRVQNEQRRVAVARSGDSSPAQKGARSQGSTRPR